MSEVTLYAGPAHCKMSKIIRREIAEFNMFHSKRVGIDKGVRAPVALYIHELGNGGMRDTSRIPPFPLTSQMLYLQSFLRKGVSLGYVGRIQTSRT